MTDGLLDALAADVRGTPHWERVVAHFETMWQPGFGRPGEPVDPALSADGRTTACTVTIRDGLDGPATIAVYIAGPEGQRLIRRDGAAVRSPRFAPVGDALVVLTDVGDPGCYRPALVWSDGLVDTPPLPGVAEAVHWSPDGSRLVAVVADPGADAAGAQGSGRISRGDAPAWLPVVMADTPVGGWRRLWCWRPGEPEWHQVSPPGWTCWEVAWCGTDSLVAVVSDRPEEAAWFDARVVRITLPPAGAEPGAVEELATGDGRCLGLPAAAPDGRWVGYVRATCSDRTVVAGDVEIVDPATGERRPLDLDGLDVTWQAFRSAEVLVVAGQSGLDTVVAEVEISTGRVVERWRSFERTCGQRYPELAVSPGGVAMVVEGYRSPPELAVLDDGATEPRLVSSFAHDGHRAVLHDAGTVERLAWTAPDGVGVDGLVVRPDPDEHGPGPHPCITYVHGGPVWAWRARWSMGYAYTLLFARAGFVVFHPNPRGSAGRGEDFRAAVLGDLGGAESDDLLSGLDALDRRGVTDRGAHAVFGGSHGGFMAAWLITRTDRFVAALPYCPVTAWDFMRLTTNDRAAQDHLLAGRPGRDPLAESHRVRTPTLVVTGGRDLITPPSQGLAFHRALAERGVTTGYVEYPLEGHGVRGFPAQFDFCARALAWFEHFCRRP